MKGLSAIVFHQSCECVAKRWLTQQVMVSSPFFLRKLERSNQNAGISTTRRNRGRTGG